MRMIIVAIVVVCSAVLTACPSGPPIRRAVGIVPTQAPPRIMDESLPAIALMNTEAPGTDVKKLTEQLRTSLQQHSGRMVVTTAMVEAELGMCTVTPCVDVVSRRFQDAAFVGRASLSRVGDVYLATIEILEGGVSVVRHGAQAKDIDGALEEAGRQAGAALYVHNNP